MIHALDDPLVPDEPYREYDWRRNRRLFPMLQPRGGHVGFHDRRGGTWHDRAVQTFFEQLLGLPCRDRKEPAQPFLRRRAASSAL